MEQPPIVEIITFSATGIILGNLWRGGTATSKMQQLLHAYSRESLIDEAKALLAQGKLTGTGDFDGEIGAILHIETKTLIIYNGKEFTNKEYEFLTIGKLTEEQNEILANRAYYQEL